MESLKDLLRRLLELLGLWEHPTTRDLKNTRKQIEACDKTIKSLENQKKDLEYEVENLVSQIASLKKEIEGQKGAKLASLSNTLSLLIQQYKAKKESLDIITSDLSTNYLLKDKLEKHISTVTNTPKAEDLADAADQAKEDIGERTDAVKAAGRLADLTFGAQTVDTSSVLDEMNAILGENDIVTTPATEEKSAESASAQPKVETPEKAAEPKTETPNAAQSTEKTIKDLEKKLNDLDL